MPESSRDVSNDEHTDDSPLKGVAGPELNQVRPERESEQFVAGSLSEITGEAEEQGPICAGRFFGFLFQRVTYYWVALIAQLCQTAGQIVGYELIDKESHRYSLFTITQTFCIGSIVSAGVLISIPFLILCHYSDESTWCANLMNAGKHHQLSRWCAWANIFCMIILKLFIRDISWGDTHNLSIIHNQIVPILLATQLVGLLACLAAATLTYVGALRSRGERMVHDPHYRTPSWTLATTYETTGYTRERAIQLEP